MNKNIFRNIILQKNKVKYKTTYIIGVEAFQEGF